MTFVIKPGGAAAGATPTIVVCWPLAPPTIGMCWSLMSGGGGPLGGLGLAVLFPHGGYIMFGSTAAGLCFTFKVCGAALYVGGSSGALHAVMCWLP